MTKTRTILEYQDVSSGFLRSANWTDDTGDVNALGDAIQDISNANLLYLTSDVPVVGTHTPGTTQYFLCTDTVVLNFQTVPGNSVQLVIPAPDASIFGSDGSTVDPTNSLIIALTGAAIGTLADQAGNLVTAYKSGVKSNRRTEQNNGI